MAHDDPPAGQPKTLAQIIKEGGQIVARCRHCDHEASVDKQALVLKLGADFRPGLHIERFREALKCTACGLNGARVTFITPRGDYPGWDGSGAHGH